MTMFQFQTGSIRSGLWICSRSNFIESFNSKLVRLEVNSLRSSPTYLFCFNSKLVRLEVNTEL